MNLYYHQLMNYLANRRWKKYGRYFQLLVAIVIGFILAVSDLVPSISTGLHGASIAITLNLLLSFWLKKGTPNPNYKSGIFWIVSILLSLGYAILFEHGMQSLRFTYNGGIEKWIPFGIFFTVFAHSKIEAIIFSNLELFWETSQNWNIRQQVWIKYLSGTIILGFFLLLLFLQ